MRPSPVDPSKRPLKQRSFIRFLDILEKYGNQLPDPVTLFIILALIMIVVSHFAAMGPVTAVHPSTGETIQAKSLLSGNGLVQMLTGMVSNFTQFPPLGLVLVIMTGVGLAEKSGLISALLKRTVLAAPSAWVIPVIIFMAMMGNATGDAAFVVLPPIAAMVLMALGYHPLVGLVVSYAAVAGGFAANLVINVLDVLVAGFTEAGAHMIDSDYVGNPAMNYYFLIASSFLLIVVCTWVTYKITIPRLGEYTGQAVKVEPLSRQESCGLRWAGISFLMYIFLLLLLTVPEDGLLRNPETGSLTKDAPFMTGIVPIITFLFFIPAVVYGIGAKTIRSDRHVTKYLGEAMKEMGPYIVLVFVAAQTIAYFEWSQLGPIIAIKGAGFLEKMNLTGIPMFIGFILLASLINLILASSSAKWAILSPVFVPMFMMLGYHPAVTQLAYRIGDSVTNPITPMLPYFVILLSFARQYDAKIGMGTLMALLLPYSIFFAVFWMLLFVLWFLFGLPLGPDGPIFLPK
ncbi:AbgT family transporter [Paludifilum halophilum]|uniref:Aminobenzoyl-glutamate transporter n=1 Tax=Paludifilum halophilum TaxID=1642702 RepID=A0A235B750_9BACL|nr:AbgT family transporter [Paludifilum halophilum]OYD08138.1 aminobenzoyl-glutamate transporter [Paludifilum halophilum]